MSTASIAKRLELIENTVRELATLKASLADFLTNDGELETLLYQQQELAQKVKSYKAAVMNEPEAVALSNKIKDAQQELKDMRAVLTDDLLGYVIEEKKMVLELENGDEYLIKFNGNANKKGN